ncbi:MAG: arginine decarboxylase, pyruvoyl-dependent [Chloroflexi bacterium]|nr:arginine decarboxylase, pyruvoyl-dependent [Chloroflexota bacterium]
MRPVPRFGEPPWGGAFAWVTTKARPTARRGAQTSNASWSAPELLWPTVGHAEGETRLNAFDNALVAAGIGHWNLVKVTSIAPPGALVIDEPLAIEAGTLVPAVLAAVSSEKAGESICSCIGIGLSTNGPGMIMEHSGAGTAPQMEEIVGKMIREAMGRRGLRTDEIAVRSVTHTVERAGSCVAAVVLWWR